MARRIRDSVLDSRNARLKLAPRGEPYWKEVERGVHIGYRRRPDGKAGTWAVREFANGKYKIDRVGVADDLSDSDGKLILSFWQAVEAIRKRTAQLGAVRHDDAPTARTTIREALDVYEADLKVRGGDVTSVARVRLHGEKLLSKAVGLVTANDLKTWRNGLRSSLSIGSVNRVASALRAALNAVADSDEKASRHAWEVGLKAVSDGEISARNVIVADGQIVKIVAASYGIDAAFGLLIEVAATTGARIGQIARITVGDLQAARVMIPTSKKGQGKKARLIPVAIPAALVLKLKAAGKGRAANDVLLVKTDGEPWGKSTHNRRFAEAVERAGFDPDVITANALRHSSIVRMIRKNIPLRIVAVTHDTSTKMIEQHYSREIADVSHDLTSAALLDLSNATAANVVAIAR
jgi:integrase